VLENESGKLKVRTIMKGLEYCRKLSLPQLGLEMVWDEWFNILHRSVWSDKHCQCPKDRECN